MIKFNVETLSIEQIDSEINYLNGLLIKEEPYLHEYTLDSLINLSIDEITRIFKEYNLLHELSAIKDYLQFIEFFQDENIYSRFSSSLSPIREEASRVVLELNELRIKKLLEIQKKNELTRKRILFFESLKTYLLPSFSHRPEEYANLTKLIIDSDLTQTEKVELSLLLSKTLRESYKSKDSPAEVIDDGLSEYRRKQIKLANDVYRKYSSVLSEDPYIDKDSIYGTFTFEDANKYETSIDKFTMLLIIAVSLVNDENVSDERIKESPELHFLENIDLIYKQYVKEITIKDSLNDEISRRRSILRSINCRFNAADKKLQELFSIFGALGNLADQGLIVTLSYAQQLLGELKPKVEAFNMANSDSIRNLSGLDIIRNSLSYIESIISGAEAKLIVEKPNETSREPVSIKSFILFDTDDTTKKAFIYEDLLGDRPFIEQSAIEGNDVSSDDKEYQKSLSRLINDLLVYGQSFHKMSTDSSHANKKAESIESPVSKTESDGSKSKDEKTALWRIKPKPESNIRFVERKIIIPHDSELFTQVVNAIQKYLPNVVINTGEDFIIFVNFGCAIKKSDTAIYGTVERRHSGRFSGPTALFYEGGKYKKQYQKALKLKQKLTDEECKILEAFIVSSLQSLYEMQKKDKKYDFSFIDRMGGEKIYGLQ